MITQPAGSVMERSTGNLLEVHDLTKHFAVRGGLLGSKAAVRAVDGAHGRFAAKQTTTHREVLGEVVHLEQVARRALHNGASGLRDHWATPTSETSSR